MCEPIAPITDHKRRHTKLQKCRYLSLHHSLLSHHLISCRITSSKPPALSHSSSSSTPSSSMTSLISASSHCDATSNSLISRVFPLSLLHIFHPPPPLPSLHVVGDFIALLDAIAAKQYKVLKLFIEIRIYGQIHQIEKLCH
uniref:Uncharacterized protein n=1 Tax=Davidia involucrata TaxID=16924 RepID=A0A5B7AL28_DAVIN